MNFKKIKLFLKNNWYIIILSIVDICLILLAILGNSSKKNVIKDTMKMAYYDYEYQFYVSDNLINVERGIYNTTINHNVLLASVRLKPNTTYTYFVDGSSSRGSGNNGVFLTNDYISDSYSTQFNHNVVNNEFWVNPYHMTFTTGSDNLIYRCYIGTNYSSSDISIFNLGIFEGDTGDYFEPFGNAFNSPVYVNDFYVEGNSLIPSGYTSTLTLSGSDTIQKITDISLSPNTDYTLSYRVSRSSAVNNILYTGLSFNDNVVTTSSFINDSSNFIKAINETENDIIFNFNSGSNDSISLYQGGLSGSYIPTTLSLYNLNFNTKMNYTSLYTGYGTYYNINDRDNGVYQQGYLDGQKDYREREVEPEQARVYYNNGYAEGMAKGYENGLTISENGSLSEMVYAVVDTPFKVIYNFLNFEVFGVNLWGLLSALLTLLFAAFVIKRLK